MNEEKIYAVFGLGSFGYEVCRTLSSKGCNVIAVDRQERLIEKVKNDVSQAVLIDSSDMEALKSAGLGEVDVAVVAIGDNMNASILTTAQLKNLNVPVIISRAISDIHAQVLRQVGATEVIILEVQGGRRLAERLCAPDVLDVVALSESQSLMEIRIPAEFEGRSLAQLDLRKKYSVNVISLKRIDTQIDDMGNPQKKETVISPGPREQLKANDVLVVLGSEQELDRFKGDIS